MINNGLKAMHILIADNESNVSYALSVLIREQPTWKLTGIVRQAEDLYTQLDASQPDLVLVDLKLPGFEIADLIERTSNMPNPPFVIAIGLDPDEEKDALARGADFVISKVDPPDRLLSALRQSQEKIAQAG